MKIVSDADDLIDNKKARKIRQSLHPHYSEQMKKLQPNNRELNCMDYKTGVQSIHKEVLRLISCDSQPPDVTISTLNDEKWKLDKKTRCQLMKKMMTPAIDANKVGKTPNTLS